MTLLNGFCSPCQSVTAIPSGTVKDGRHYGGDERSERARSGRPTGGTEA